MRRRGKNDGPRPDDVAAIEVHLTRCWIDAGDIARDQNLCSERPACLSARLASSSPEPPLGNPK